MCDKFHVFQIYNNFSSNYLITERLINGIFELKQALAFKYQNQNNGEHTEAIDQRIEQIYKTAQSEYSYLKMFAYDFDCSLSSISIWGK